MGVDFVYSGGEVGFAFWNYNYGNRNDECVDNHAAFSVNCSLSETCALIIANCYTVCAIPFFFFFFSIRSWVEPLSFFYIL